MRGNLRRATKNPIVAIGFESELPKVTFGS